MFVLILCFRNGEVTYHGPFKSEERATEYGRAFAQLDRGLANHRALARWFVKPLIAPFNP